MKETDPIRVVVLTGGAELQPDVVDFVEHLESHPDTQLVGIVCQSDIRGFPGVIKDLWNRRGLLAVPLLVQRWLRKSKGAVLAPRRAAARRRITREVADRLYFCPDLHSAPVLTRIRDLRPDLGLVYGGPIIRPDLYGLPRLGTLGIHHGLTPRYRGKKTTFWAMYNGEEYVGVTIQRISASLDRGDVVAEGVIPVGRSPLPVITARLNRLGLELYLQAVLRVRQGTAEFRPQTAGDAPLYRDPSASDIVRFWCRYLARLAKPPRQRT